MVKSNIQSTPHKRKVPAPFGTAKLSTNIYRDSQIELNKLVVKYILLILV